MKTKLLIVLLLAWVFLNACGTGHRQRALLQKAEACLAESPDLALLYLDSIYSPESQLAKEDYMDYVLLHAEAAWNSGADVKADTAIFEAASYYEKKGDLLRQAKAELYSGCVWNERGERGAAMASFKQANRLGNSLNDSATVAYSQFYIGKMLFNEGHIDLALKTEKESYRASRQMMKLNALCLNAMASSYIMLGQYDSARICLDEGYAVAEKYDITSVRSSLLNQYFVLYRKTGDYENASHYMGSMMQETDSVMMPYLYLNLVQLYSDKGQLDSADFYGQKLLDVLSRTDCTDETKASCHYYLSELYEKSGEYSKAISHLKEYDKLQYQVMDKWQEAKLFEIQRKFDFEEQQNQYNSQLLKRSRIALGLAVSLLILTSVVAFLMYRTAQKNKQLERIKDELLSFKRQNKDLQENLSMQEDGQHLLADCENRLEKELRLRHRLLCQYEIYRTNKGDKAALEAMRAALYGKKDFKKATLNLFGQLYPGLSDVIRQRYPELSEQDFMSVVLSYFNVSRADEALLLGISVDMVDKNRTRIRKMMTGFTPDKTKSSE